MKNLKRILAGLFFMLLIFIVAAPQEISAKEAKNKSYTATREYKSYKDISMRFSTINKMRKQTSSLSAEDKEIITKYVFGAVRGEDTFLIMNAYLRENLKDYIPAKEITKPLGYRLNYYSEGLKSSISRVKLPQNTTLYAALDDKCVQHIFGEAQTAGLISKPATKEIADKLASKIVGKTYNNKGFISSSYDKNCINKTKFRLEIKAPKNIHAVSIEDLGEKNKKRVIINLNYNWEVMAVTCEYDKDKKTNYYNIIIKNMK